MDPVQPPVPPVQSPAIPTVQPESPPNLNDETTPTKQNKISQFLGEYISKHYEDGLHLIVKWVMAIIKFIQFVVTQIVKQVIS